MRRAATLAILIGAAAAACNVEREPTPLPVVFDRDVAPILEERCVRCHGGDAPAAGWSATSYLGAIGCVTPSGDAAVLPADARAPIVRALGQPSHAGFASGAERAVLTSWVEGGAPAFRGTVHDPGVVDPRSPAFHGAMLRKERWSPMLDESDPNACGRCHDGTPVRPPGVTSPAPGATACTSCHDQPNGVLACGTCHGDGARASPPRDLCFFPGDRARAGAHLAHVEPSNARATGLACETCHPVPGADVISGLHGNGSVEIVFDPKLVSGEASYDATSGGCAVSCHDAGGERPRPSWDETKPMTCNDCHRSPPAGHFKGACDRCHREANADGTELVAGPLHLNGRVDLGDGSGGCGACHGHGDDPWPASGAHDAHRDPGITTAIACSDCHVVPVNVLDPGHIGDGVARVVFSGRAIARGAAPAWTGKACVGVACHGAGLAEAPAIAEPRWSDVSGAAAACGACHGIPPTQHTPSTSCGRSTCHSGETSPGPDGAPRITAAGRALHVNGAIDVAP
jgi:predicted CxxxxCH...CXXCH cytochrome family protein